MKYSILVPHSEPAPQNETPGVSFAHPELVLPPSLHKFPWKSQREIRIFMPLAEVAQKFLLLLVRLERFGNMDEIQKYLC